MKNVFKILIIALVLFNFSCSKEEVSNQVGSWEGIEFQTIKTDGIQTSENSTSIQLTLMESGSGNLVRPIGFGGIVHWVVDETENNIYIISDINLSSGSAATVTDKFDMIVNTDSEQKWEKTINYQLSTGEENEVFTRWSLLKQ